MKATRLSLLLTIAKFVYSHVLNKNMHWALLVVVVSREGCTERL